MKCSNCGFEFEGKFCPNCGTAAPAAQAEDRQTAPASAAPANGTSLWTMKSIRLSAKAAKWLPAVLIAAFAVLCWVFFLLPAVNLMDVEASNIFDMLNTEEFGAPENWYIFAFALVGVNALATLCAIVYLAFVGRKFSLQKEKAKCYFSWVMYVAEAAVAIVLMTKINSYFEDFGNAGTGLILVIAAAAVCLVASMFCMFFLRKKALALPEFQAMAYANDGVQAGGDESVREVDSAMTEKEARWRKIVSIFAVVLLAIWITFMIVMFLVNHPWKKNYTMTDAEKFTAETLQLIEYKMDSWQVRNLMGGDPDNRDYDSYHVWIYHSGDYGALYKELQDIDRQMNSTESFKELAELDEKYEETKAKMKELTFDRVTISFDDSSVIAVLLEKNLTEGEFSAAQPENATKVKIGEGSFDEETQAMEVSQREITSPDYYYIPIRVLYDDGSYRMFEETLSSFKNFDRCKINEEQMATYTYGSKDYFMPIKVLLTMDYIFSGTQLTVDNDEMSYVLTATNGNSIQRAKYMLEVSGSGRFDAAKLKDLSDELKKEITFLGDKNAYKDFDFMDQVSRVTIYSAAIDNMQFEWSSDIELIIGGNVTQIAPAAFTNFDTSLTIYFDGSKSTWEQTGVEYDGKVYFSIGQNGDTLWGYDRYDGRVTTYYYYDL